MLAHRRAAAATLERIAHGRAPARIGRVDPDIELVLLNVTIKVEIADAGLDHGVVNLVVDLEYPVHAFQIDDDAAREHG